MILNTLWGPEEIYNTKVCSDCGEEKTIDDFGTRAHRKDGTRETHNFWLTLPVAGSTRHCYYCLGYEVISNLF